MKKDKFLLYVLLGVGAIGAWYYYKNRNKNNKKDIVVADLTNENALQPEKITFPEPFVNDYNIVMPSDLVSAKVREKSAQLREGRFAIQPDKVQEPLFL